MWECFGGLSDSEFWSSETSSLCLISLYFSSPSPSSSHTNHSHQSSSGGAAGCCWYWLSVLWSSTLPGMKPGVLCTFPLLSSFNYALIMKAAHSAATHHTLRGGGRSCLCSLPPSCHLHPFTHLFFFLSFNFSRLFLSGPWFVSTPETEECFYFSSFIHYLDLYYLYMSTSFYILKPFNYQSFLCGGTLKWMNI